MAPSSFGLSPDGGNSGQFKTVVYEEIFDLVNHCGMTWSESWDMPVVLRHWWFERTTRLREQQKNGGRPSGHTDPFGRKHP